MKNETIIVTGGAMSLGLATARELAARDSGYVSGHTIAIDGGESNTYGNF